MKPGSNPLIGFSVGLPVILLLLTPLGLPVVWRVLNAEPRMFLPFWALAFFGLLVPTAIIILRHHIRRMRIKQIELFEESFGERKEDDTAVFSGPSFEFVRGKYYAGLEPAFAAGTKVEHRDIPFFPFVNSEDRMLLVAAVPFTVVSMIGTLLLFAPIGSSLNAGWLAEWVPPSFLTSDPTPGQSLEQDHRDVLAIAGITFAGAYLFSLRLLLRSVLVFDLNPATFLRVFCHIVTTMTAAVILFRGVEASGLADGIAAIAGRLDLSPTSEPAADGPLQAWFVLAFAIGFVPEGGISLVLSASRLLSKTRYSHIERHTKQIPLTVLDGIDHFIAFRLEEANIYDVQNLATYNPIMLDIESPYGIYQTIDWVAQAQLCTLVGVERFLLFRSINVRTIFDLKTAVLTDKADAGLLNIIGQILLRDTTRSSEMRAEIGLGDLPSAGHGPLAVEAVKQLTEMMLDDLHFTRLAKVWELIRRRLEDDQKPVVRLHIEHDGQAA